MPIYTSSQVHRAQGTRSMAFVDAGYVRRAAQLEGGEGRVQLRGESIAGMLDLVSKPSWLLRTYVYDGQFDRETHSDRWQDQRAELDQLRSCDGIDLRLGHVVGEGKTIRQKGVDTLLVLDMLRLAHDGAYDVALLVAGDADFVEAVDAVKRLGKFVSLVAGQGAAQELRNAADINSDLTGVTLESLIHRP